MDNLATSLALGRVLEAEIGDRGLRARLQRLDRPNGVETDWIQVAAPMIGPGAGVIFAPEPDDLAVLAFAGKRQVILGFMNAAQVESPTTELEERTISSRQGNMLKLIDGGDSGITLADEHGNEIVMNKDGISIKTSGTLTLEAARTTTIKGQTVELNP